MSSTAPSQDLKLLLTAPPQPVRVAVTDSFPISVDVTLANVSQCEVTLTFDTAVFEEISGQANPRSLAGGIAVSQSVRWRLRVKGQPPQPTFVSIEARANGLFQQAQFQVEVI